MFNMNPMGSNPMYGPMPGLPNMQQGGMGQNSFGMPGMGILTAGGMTVINNYGYSINFPGMRANNGYMQPVNGFASGYNNPYQQMANLTPPWSQGSGMQSGSVTQVLVGIIGLLLKSLIGGQGASPTPVPGLPVPGLPAPVPPPALPPGDIDYSSANKEHYGRIAGANATAIAKFSQFDAGIKNGTLDEAEYKTTGLSTAFSLVDVDKNGQITPQEYAAALFGIDANGDGIATAAEQSGVAQPAISQNYNDWFKSK